MIVLLVVLMIVVSMTFAHVVMAAPKAFDDFHQATEELGAQVIKSLRLRELLDWIDKRIIARES